MLAPDVGIGHGPGADPHGAGERHGVAADQQREEVAVLAARCLAVEDLGGPEHQREGLGAAVGDKGDHVGGGCF